MLTSPEGRWTPDGEAHIRNATITGGGSRWKTTPFRSSQSPRQIWLPAAFVAVYVATSLVAYKWTVVPGGLAVLWLNNGLVAAALLLLSRSSGLAVAAIGLAADVLGSRILGGSPWGQSALIGGFDLSEAWLAAVLIRNLGGAGLDLTQLRRFAAVILGGVLPATILVGTTGALLFASVYHQPFGPLWLNWAVGDFLGMSIGAPSALIIARFRRFDQPKALSPLASIGVVLVLCTVGFLAFHFTGRPLAFIIFPLLLIAAFRLTPPYGAVAGVLIAIVATANTLAGYGQFAASRAGPQLSILLVQLFLSCVFFSLFLAQGSLAERARAQARALKALARVSRARSQAEAALADLAASEFRFQLFADNADDVICRYHPDGHLAYISPSARELFGHEPEELIASDAHWHLIHPEDLEPALVWLRAFFADDMEHCAERFEFRIVQPSGEVRWVESTRRVVRDTQTGEILELHSILRDITQRKTLETELEARRVEAEAASVAKSQFLANMSHEIRTPLNGVIAMADLLARANLDERERRIAEIIRASGDSLNRLLSDILDLARIEAGRVELEYRPFQFGEAVRSAVALCSLHAQEKGVQLKVEVSPDADRHFDGDEVRIRQIVTNLVSNAIKFTAEGEVRVRVSALEPVGVRIEVTDTGIGFDPALRGRLFDRFQQADGSITRRFGGTGLGLPISRQLAELMGGSLDCESTPGKGSRFWFEARLQPADPVEVAAGAEAGASSAGGRVLVVDDHPTNQTVAELILRDFGFDVDAAENGAEAVEAFERGGLDLILMDMQMPVMDGLTAVRRIRALESEQGLPRTPILMLSANALPEHAEQSAAAGADGHVAKPITAAALMNAIAAVAEAADPAAVEAMQSSRSAVG